MQHIGRQHIIDTNDTYKHIFYSVFFNEECENIDKLCTYNL